MKLYINLHINIYIKDAIMANKPSVSNEASLVKFMDYFVNTYFEGIFPVAVWNHFNTVGPRTNNNIEGYHLKLPSQA